MARKSFLVPEDGTDVPAQVEPAREKPQRRLPMAKGGATAPHYIANAIKSQEGRAVQDIPIDKIAASAISDRLDVTEDIDDLLRSIEANGQQIPISVRPIDGDLPYEIVVGRRRLEALRRLGRPTIRGFVTKMTDRESFIAQGIENNGRLETSFIEKARAVTLARDAGFAQEEISEFLSTSAPNISVMERIYRSLGEDLVQAIGPARGIGRRKWDAVEKATARYRTDGKNPIELVDRDRADSVDRFEAFESAISAGPSPAPPRGTTTGRRKHLDGRIATQRKPGQLVIRRSKFVDEDFLAYVEDRIADLHGEYENRNKDA